MEPTQAGDKAARPVDVVIISDFGQINGGAAQVAIESAIGLRQCGFRVYFVYAVAPLDPRLEQSGVITKHLELEEAWAKRNPLGAAVEGIWNASAAALLREFLSSLDRQRTIVHFHQWTKCFSPSTLAAALALGFNTIITMHDYFLTCPNGAFYRFPGGQRCRLQPLSVGCCLSDCDSRSRAHKLVRLARQATQNIALSRKSARPTIIHVSDFARMIAEPHCLTGARHETVPNPVLYEAMPRCEPERQVDFLFVGRLVPEKGCLEFAQAAQHAGISAVFAGEGGAAEALRQANPAARLLGWVTPDKIRTVIRGARAVVFPSRWPETSGLICLQALANGVPIIASRDTAAASLVEPGVNGVLLEPDDPASFIAAFRQFEADEAVAGMSRAAYDRYWASPFSVERHVGTLIPIYRAAYQQAE